MRQSRRVLEVGLALAGLAWSMPTRAQFGAPPRFQEPTYASFAPNIVSYQIGLYFAAALVGLLLGLLFSDMARGIRRYIWWGICALFFLFTLSAPYLWRDDQDEICASIKLRRIGRAR